MLGEPSRYADQAGDLPPPEPVFRAYVLRDIFVRGRFFDAIPPLGDMTWLRSQVALDSVIVRVWPTDRLVIWSSETPVHRPCTMSVKGIERTHYGHLVGEHNGATNHRWFGIIAAACDIPDIQYPDQVPAVCRAGWLEPV